MSLPTVLFQQEICHVWLVFFVLVKKKTTGLMGNFQPVLETLRLTFGLTSKQLLLYHLRDNLSELQVIFVTFGSSFRASSPATRPCLDCFLSARTFLSFPFLNSDISGMKEGSFFKFGSNVRLDPRTKRLNSTGQRSLWPRKVAFGCNLISYFT